MITAKRSKSILHFTGIAIFLLRLITGIVEYNIISYRGMYVINCLLQVLFILISIAALLFKPKIKRMRFFEIALFFFGLMVFIYSINAVHTSNIEYFFFMITLVPYSIATYFFFSSFDSKKEFTSLHLGAVFTLLIVLFVVAIIRTNRAFDYYEIYPIICFSPLLFLKLSDRNRFKSILLISLLVIFISILSNKRTAVLTCVIGLIFLVSSHLYLKANSAKRFFVIVATVMMVFIGYSLFVSISNKSNNDFLYSFSYSEFVSNSRIIIWNNAAQMFNQCAPINKLFGNGFEAFSKVSSTNLQAHNDFIELLYDYGIVGLSLYILFCLGIFVSSLSDLSRGAKNSDINIMCITLLLIISSLSILYYNAHNFSLLMGYFGIYISSKQAVITPRKALLYEQR